MSARLGRPLDLHAEMENPDEVPDETTGQQ
jgi:hypothetical protein